VEGYAPGREQDPSQGNGQNHAVDAPRKCFCHNCGFNLAEDKGCTTRFCPGCGTEI